MKTDLNFPLCVFPKMVRDIIMDAHEELNFPESYIAASILSATATAIGNSAILNIRDDWKEKCVLFIVLLGRSGTVKTPPMSFAYAPLLKLDCQSIQQYNKDMNDYLSSAEKNNEKRPKARQRIVKDCTLEAVAKVLSENPLGIVVLNDELKGWISSFDRYHKSGGGDMEQWMTLFNSEPIIVNRKGAAEVICVPSPFVNVIGSLQTEVLPKLFSNDRIDNGFLFRLLFVVNPHEDEPVLWKEDDLPTNVGKRWEDFLLSIVKFAESDRPNHRPMEFTFEENAEKNIHAWRDIQEWQNNIELNNGRDGTDKDVKIFRKVQSCALRFCIPIQVMWDIAEGRQPSGVISESTAILATLLADYFYSTAKEVYDLISEGEKNHTQFFRLLGALDTRFTTAQALAVGESMGISRRTIFNYLDVKEDDPFLTKLRHGRYEKKL